MEPIHNGCTQCGSPDYEEGYVNQLCRECRKQMSRFPIASWVKWTGIGVAVLFLISLFNMPKAIRATMTYNKARELFAEHKYESAEKAFHQILQRYPSNFKMNAYYAMSAFHNEHYNISDSVLGPWRGRKVEDQETTNMVNSVLSEAEDLNLSDESIYGRIDSASGLAESIDILEKYTLLHKEEAAAKLLLASYYSQDSNYTGVIALCEEVKMLKPDVLTGHRLLAHAYCEQKQYEKGLKVCDEMLDVHAEFIDALILKAKILLKQKQDKKAFQVARQAYDLAPADLRTVISLGLASHFSGEQATLKDMQAKLNTLVDTAGINWFNNVIHNNISYRD
jgi:pentatricopeptide repeat protein